ncbi:MAG: hypothetical protein Q9195_005242 [Heterodermia aff. obscurata]
MKHAIVLLLLASISSFSSASPTNNVIPSRQNVNPKINKHLRPVLEKRQEFDEGEPIDAKGKGAPILGGTDKQIDLQNPDNLGAQSTDNGVVPNVKWRFSDSKTRLLSGGWVREQVITDLPASKDIAAAQQHLTKGSIRELHWHRVAEWGYVYAGKVRVAAVDEHGENQVDDLDATLMQPGNAESRFLRQNVNKRTRTTFNVDDWITHTPKDILAKNFGVDESLFDAVPTPNPYILKSNATDGNVTSPYGKLEGNSSYVYHLSRIQVPQAPGGGGTIAIVDSRNFPIATTIAAAVVTLEPHGLRELHWHPNVSSISHETAQSVN